MHRVRKGRFRFHLLHLDEGEVYFQDHTVHFHYTPAEQGVPSRRVKGLLKVCSHSLVFDPDERALPLVRYRYADVRGVRATPSGDVCVSASQVVELMHGDVVAPYKFVKQRVEHVFTLAYGDVQGVLRFVDELRGVCAIADRRARDAALARVVARRERAAPFDASLIELRDRRVFECVCSVVRPLVVNPGRVVLTNRALYVQFFNNVEAEPVRKFMLRDVVRVCKRRHTLRPVGVEVFLDAAADAAQSLFVSFAREYERDAFLDALMAQKKELKHLATNDFSNMTKQWQAGAVSNCDYLLFLNFVAGRTFNDLTQYPVFPWVIHDFTSPTLDLADARVYRDLSKPIGALNAERLAMLQERYREMPEPRFHYGTHYSTPGYVLYFLVRQVPELMLRLQNGQFDAPDRLFHSIESTWTSVFNNPADVKELIPDFYIGDGSFLVNKDRLNLGVRQNGAPVGDVALPPWAKNAEDFVQKMRDALESDHVSAHLHEWIDLIFGYKQKGKEAEKASNVFYYLTYEGAVNLERITDPREREAIIAQINEFGQTPRQLFPAAHPPRAPPHERRPSTPLHAPAARELSSPNLMARVMTPPPPMALLDEEGGAGDDAAAVVCSQFATLRKTHTSRIYRDAITAMCLSDDGGTVYTCGVDSSLKIFSVGDRKQLRSFQVGELPLSACQLTADGKHVVAGSWDNNVYLYSIDYGRVAQTVRAHDDAVSGVRLVGSTLVTASWDSTVKVWDVERACAVGKAPVAFFMEHDASIKCLDVSADGRTAVTGSEDGVVIVWDLRQKRSVAHVYAHNDEVHAVRMLGNTRFVTGSAEWCVKVWDAAAGAELSSVTTEDAVRCLATSGGTHVVAGTAGGALLGLHVQGGVVMDVTRVGSHAAHGDAVTCVEISRDGALLVSGGQDNTQVFWGVQ